MKHPEDRLGAAQRAGSPEQSRTLCRPRSGSRGSRPSDKRGKADGGSGRKATGAPAASAGVLASACLQDGRRGNTRSPVGDEHASTGKPQGSGRAGRVASRPVRLKRPGNAARGSGRRRGEWSSVWLRVAPSRTAALRLNGAGSRRPNPGCRQRALSVDGRSVPHQAPNTSLYQSRSCYISVRAKSRPRNKE